MPIPPAIEDIRSYHHECILQSQFERVANPRIPYCPIDKKYYRQKKEIFERIKEHRCLLILQFSLHLHYLIRQLAAKDMGDDPLFDKLGTGFLYP